MNSFSVSDPFSLQNCRYSSSESVVFGAEADYFRLSQGCFLYQRERENGICNKFQKYTISTLTRLTEYDSHVAIPSWGLVQLVAEILFVKPKVLFRVARQLYMGKQPFVLVFRP